jgi:hypothetical protein
MYHTYDEEVFLAPESIISSVVATAAFVDEPELPDIEPLPRSWLAAAARRDADTDDADVDEPASFPAETGPIEVWSRYARGANGFGG